MWTIHEDGSIEDAKNILASTLAFSTVAIRHSDLLLLEIPLAGYNVAGKHSCAPIFFWNKNRIAYKEHWLPRY